MAEGMRSPLYFQLPELQVNPPTAAECDVCFAVVLLAHLDAHKRAAHG